MIICYVLNLASRGMIICYSDDLFEIGHNIQISFFVGLTEQLPDRGESHDKIIQRRSSGLATTRIKKGFKKSSCTIDCNWRNDWYRVIFRIRESDSAGRSIHYVCLSNCRDCLIFCHEGTGRIAIIQSRLSVIYGYSRKIISDHGRHS